MKAILFLMFVAMFRTLQARPLEEQKISCNSLPPDHKRHEGLTNAYKLHQEKSTRNEAKDKCESKGGYLAVFKSKEESRIFGNLIKSQSTANFSRVWINAVSTLHEEDFLKTVWITEWNPDMSDDRKNNCVLVDLHGKLLKIHCTYEYNYVCEIPCNNKEVSSSDERDGQKIDTVNELKPTTETTENLNRTVETQEDIKPTAETQEDFKQTAETQDDLKQTVETQEDLKPTAEAQEISNPTVEPREDLKQTVESREDLKPIVETREDVKETTECQEDFKPTVESREDLKQTTESQENFNPTVESREDLNQTVESQEDLKPIVDVQEDLKPTVESQEDLKPTVDIQEDLKPTVESQEDLKLTVDIQEDLKPTVDIQEDLKPTEPSDISPTVPDTHADTLDVHGDHVADEPKNHDDDKNSVSSLHAMIIMILSMQILVQFSG